MRLDNNVPNMSTKFYLPYGTWLGGPCPLCDLSTSKQIFTLSSPNVCIAPSHSETLKRASFVMRWWFLSHSNHRENVCGGGSPPLINNSHPKSCVHSKSWPAGGACTNIIINTGKWEFNCDVNLAAGFQGRDSCRIYSVLDFFTRGS